MKKRVCKILAAAAILTALCQNVAFAGEWKQGAAPNESRWWYDNQDGTYAVSGWQWLDGNGDGIAECYYFDENGWMLADTVTPDGYTVNAAGAWIQDGWTVTRNVTEAFREEGQNSRIAATLTVGGQNFRACLYDNEAVTALTEQFPVTITMNELNGNEKYHYFDTAFPTDTEQIGSIHTGDLMLYGSDCLVLFYEDFHTSYRYTRLGYVENPEGLKDALGRGNVTVTFELLREDAPSY